MLFTDEHPSRAMQRGAASWDVTSGDISLHHDFRHVRDIGRGSFGKVGMFVELSNDTVCAVKQVWVDKGSEAKALREIETLRHIRDDPHPNLLSMVRAWTQPMTSSASVDAQRSGLSTGFQGDEEQSWGTTTESSWGWSTSTDSFYATLSVGDFQKDPKLLCIQTELCDESLHDWLYGKGRDVMLAVHLDIFTQLVAATGHLHYLGFVHRDIKPANVLLCNNAHEHGNPRAKLADFGQAKWIGRGREHRSEPTSSNRELSLVTCTADMGSPQYASPELRTVGEGGKVGFETDIWSLGIVLFELLSRFSTFMERSQALHSFESSQRIPAEFSEEHAWASDLIERMTAADVSRRCSVVAILHAVHCAL